MIKKIVIGLIKIYKKIKTFSIKMGFVKQSCRFTPTCSNYCKKTIKRYGIIKGMPICFKRVMRCNPWTQGGNDPVC